MTNLSEVLQNNLLSLMELYKTKRDDVSLYSFKGVLQHNLVLDISNAIKKRLLEIR